MLSHLVTLAAMIREATRAFACREVASGHAGTVSDNDPTREGAKRQRSRPGPADVQGEEGRVANGLDKELDRDPLFGQALNQLAKDGLCLSCHPRKRALERQGEVRLPPAMLEPTAVTASANCRAALSRTIETQGGLNATWHLAPLPLATSAWSLLRCGVRQSTPRRRCAQQTGRETVLVGKL